MGFIKMDSQEYYDWLSKFEKRNTSDDTFTPPAVYDVVLDYVDKHIISLNGMTVERPFYPNGDYQAHAKNYDEKTLVIDNPPFSILSKIIDFYVANNIKFFLFAPALTVFTTIKKRSATAIICNADIVYDNKARVRTAFVTNLCGDVVVKTAPELYQKFDELNEKNKVNLPKYEYPNHVLTVNRLQKMVKAGIYFEVTKNQCQNVGRLDSQKAYKKALFGGGLLIGDDKAKETQIKELQIKDNLINWELSERERAIIKTLT